jgi:glycosyltransferase involved in cell wall biosynthesis
MKIAYLFGSLNRGGAETLLLDVFKQSSMDIIGIHRLSGVLYNDYKDSGKQMIQVRPRFILDPAYFISLRRVLKKNKVDIVHAQQAIDALYAWISCLGTGIKIVLTFHGYNTRYGKKKRMLTQSIINLTDLNIYVSNSQIKNYIDFFKVKKIQKQVVVYNGVSFKKFNNIEGMSIKEEFGISNSSILMGSVGNFVSGRDQFTICKFLNLLNQKKVDFAFIFAGGKKDDVPWLFHDCVKYCNDHGLSNKVFFPGSRIDVPNILSQIDAFIYSTNHDTFGIAVIEAMAAGIPVFVNDWEVMVEITDQGKHGIVYKTKDEKDLLSHFLGYLENRSAYQNKAREDALWARDQYSIQAHIESLKEKYQSVIDKA